MSAVEAAVEPVCIQQNGQWHAYTVTNFDAAKNNYLTYAGPVRHEVPLDPNWCQREYGVHHLPHVGAGSDAFVLILSLIGGVCMGFAATIFLRLHRSAGYHIDHRQPGCAETEMLDLVPANRNKIERDVDNG